MVTAWLVGCASFVAWIVLMIGRGGFWRPLPLLDAAHEMPDLRENPPSVAAIIPARNEESVLAQTLPSVLGQEYDGPFRVILVDDRSEDATSEVALRAAEASGCSNRLTVHSGQTLPHGWAGKVWALHQGAALAGAAEYLWLTDADIEHDPGVLRSLVAQATHDRLDLVSLMARLRIDALWDRLLIPAFVYFFAKLYPFRWINDVLRRTAGAAGGCVLVRRKTLDEAGGVEAIRGALIDDCALGRLVKGHGGRIWLGFTNSVRSVRVYGTLRSVWDMVARSAFHQLGYSVPMLIGTVIGMLLIYAAPPIIAIGGFLLAAGGTPGGVPLGAVGVAAWGLMTFSFVPLLRHQRSWLWLAPLLPLAGVLYTAMTLSSAWRYATGRGGMWKGRPYTGS
jgi:hopene-associated glycosyltransferase HpnB